jgi:hypothetical protein
MKLHGKLIKGTRTLKEAFVQNDEVISYRDQLEECLIRLCKELDIQVPIWLKTNSTQIVRYKKTSFAKEQFVEKTTFDRFEINITDQ